MYSRREDTRLRVPSPAVTRRQFQSRETQSSAAVYSDDPFVSDHHRYRSRSRDPSPAGIGRLSTSAPPGGESYLFNRRYRDPRLFDHHADFYGYTSSTASHVAFGRTTPAKDPQPRRSRPVSASSSSGRIVNGDAWGAHQPSARGRPKSFPDPRGIYVSELGSQRDYGGFPLQSARDYGGVPPSQWPREVAQDHSGRRQPGSSFGSEQAAAAVVSPNSSSEALEAVREGMSRMGVGSDQVQEGSFTCDDGYTWHSTLACLTCYLCAQLFRRPRILPCGHTFCSECLAQLKDESLREARRIPGGHMSCTVESRQKADVGMQFVCPMPECRYSMRLINLSKWSTRNKTVADTVDAMRKIYENRQDACTQTDITMDSMLVTIPRSFMPAMQDTPSPGSERALVRRNSTTSLVDRVVHRAISMDSLSRSYLPQQHGTWRGYAAMLGMHILQQVLHT
ncbi:uncharacterized protein LOC143277637 [Babylonia areolata]|uniref:uncharacterized protein LOC143277637 n=1 Tax=Babylonia areolata TaxID=304850 RepID=UPI003FD3029D